MNIPESTTRAIQRRKSCRSYSGIPLTTDERARVEEILALHSRGPFGNHVQFRLADRLFESSGEKIRIGTYGFISGATSFIAGAIENRPYCFEDYGYLMESIILKLTDMNLGTCWLGGTFNRGRLAAILGTGYSMLIPAITPVGHPAGEKTLRERIIRWGAGSDERKDHSELFFENDFSHPLPAGNAYATPLEMLRLAPSASNKQPWRILHRNEVFHFFLERTAGYGKIMQPVDLQRTDMGIACAHFELTCRELGLPGKWIKMNPDFTVSQEYIISWTPTE